MKLGTLYALLREQVGIASITVLASVAQLLYTSGHPTFDDPDLIPDLNSTEQTELAGVVLRSTQADVIAVYCIGYFTGEYPQVTTDYQDWIIAQHTIGEWVSWESAVRLITGYGTGRWATIRAKVWGDPVPFGDATGQDAGAFAFLSGPPLTPGAGVPQITDADGPPVPQDGPEYAPVPDLLHLTRSALSAALVALDKVINSPARPTRSLAAYVQLTDLIVEIKAQEDYARQG